MKFLRSISLVAVAALALAFNGCKKDDDSKPEAQVQLEKLSKSWNLTSVTLEGSPRTDFQNVVLTISGSFNSSTPLGPYTYRFTGTFPQPSPWPKDNNTWSFGEGAVQSVIIREPDDAQINYTVSGNALTLTFNYTGAGFGGGVFARANEVGGEWVFNFEAAN
jgi:hypothetical protein